MYRATALPEEMAFFLQSNCKTGRGNQAEFISHDVVHGPVPVLFNPLFSCSWFCANNRALIVCSDISGVIIEKKCQTVLVGPELASTVKLRLGNIF